MLNNFQRDPGEFRRIVSIIRGGMTWQEIERFLALGNDLIDFAKALRVNTNNSRRIIAYTIWRKLRLEEPTVPYISGQDLPSRPVAPPTTPISNTTDPVPCEGCGGVGEAEGLRWTKVDYGQPVTYSVDRTAAPDVPGFADEEIDGWFEVWADVCGITFERVSGVGDIHIKFDSIDGQGNTLGFVWQPVGNTEDMTASGQIGGDMTIDKDERSWPIWLTRTVGRHEVGHAIGLAHSEDELDLMYGSVYLAREVFPSLGDIAEARQRYPVKDIQS